MAGDGYRQFTRETLAADTVQHYLMDQAVMAFDSASQRGTELVTPEAGMVSYLRDTDRYEGRTPGPTGLLEGGSWRGFARDWGVVTGALPTPSTTDPTAPQNGDTCYPSTWVCRAIVLGGRWRQAGPRFQTAATAGTPPIPALSGLPGLVTAAAAAGQPFPVGFLVYVEQTDRLYALDAIGVFRLVGGRPGSEVNAFGSTTPATGWSLVTNFPTLQHHGNGMATVSLDVTRTGANITPSTTGKITNVPLATLPAEWAARGASPMGPGAAGNRPAFGIITALSRVVSLTSVGGTADIATGATVSLVGTYPLAAPQDMTA